MEIYDSLPVDIRQLQTKLLYMTPRDHQTDSLLAEQPELQGQGLGLRTGLID
jgi:hypothetical protein